MKAKFLFPLFFIVAIIGMWLFNLFAYGGFSTFEKGLSKASNLFAQEKYLEARLEAEKAVDLKPDNVEGRLLLAKILLNSNETYLAEKQYQEILKIKPRNAEAVKYLVYINNLTQNYDTIHHLLDRYDDKSFLLSFIPKEPVPSKTPGSYSNTISLSLKSDKDSVKILYTTDGSEPDYTSAEYSEPIILNKGIQQVKTRSNLNGFLSDTVIFEYDIKNDYAVIKFANPKLEDAIRNYINKDLDEITTEDIKDITSVLILGTEIYFDIEDSFSSFRKIDESTYTLDSITLLRNSQKIEYPHVPQGNYGDLRDLEYFENLTSLHIYSQDELNLYFIDKLEKLEKLTASNNVGLRNIEGINSLSELKELNLINNNIEDISKIVDLNKLHSLDLSFNNISDISNLTNFKLLTDLKLFYNNITTIEPILNLFTLENLAFDHNQVSDISGIRNIYNLKSLSFDYNNVNDISEIQSLESLENLSFYKNPVKDKTLALNLPKISSISKNNISKENYSTK